jgi:hypothetical protein
MERKLWLAIKDKDYNSKKVNDEIAGIRKMLPYIESFQAFFENNYVIDTNNYSVISKHERLLELYEAGADNNTSVLLFCKN